MIYDLKVKQGDVNSVLDRIRDLVDEDNLSGMIIVLKDKKTGTLSRFLMEGDTNVFEWIGALEVTKTDMVESVLYE